MTTLVWLGFAQASLIFDRQELLLLNPTYGYLNFLTRVCQGLCFGLQSLPMR
ncbi:hypothetical protein GQR42_21825 [Microcystis aeruginosa FD4]|uniref:Uncharacterized protein n=1 Tax=Microcystis aeruginosa FD4 TaxID=2686288 RepID=A0A857D7Z8_MICAE|nr:hypothetical protein GQR42_21825 [Microcystis aeruginosa FD4]